MSEPCSFEPGIRAACMVHGSFRSSMCSERVASLEAQLAQGQADLNVANGQIDILRQERNEALGDLVVEVKNVAALTTQLRRVTEALSKHGSHTKDCHVFCVIRVDGCVHDQFTPTHPPPIGCTCGLTAALTETPNG